MARSHMMAKAAAAGVIAAAASVAFAGSAVADPDAPLPAPPAVPAAPAPPDAPVGFGAATPPVPDQASSALSAPVAAALGPTPLAGAQLPGLGAPLGAAGINLLGQRNSDGSAAGPLGLPQNISGLSPDSALGQNAVPSRPGSGPGTTPNLHAFNNAYGVQQCLTPSAPGQCQEFGVEPGQENADITGHEWLHRYIDMYHDGRLRGGSLSQLSQQQLGEPLPGTAPPPGTNIPPGLGQYYAPPDAPPPPGVPPAPGTPPAPPATPAP
jgi:hypothetical protein